MEEGYCRIALLGCEIPDIIELEASAARALEIAGAIVAGIIADAAGFPAAIVTVAGLTGASGLLVAFRMRETMLVPSLKSRY